MGWRAPNGSTGDGWLAGLLSSSYLAGDQSGLITVADSGMLATGNPARLVNGDLTTANTFFNPMSAAGQSLVFALATPKIVTEVTFLQQAAAGVNNSFVWQGGNDDAAWTTLATVNNFSKATATEVHTQLNRNATAYSYYRLLGISGTITSGPYIYQFQFKVV